MAFWALYGKPWFIRPFPNMIGWYKKYLYDQWYNSLSEEEKIKIQEYKEAKRKKDREELNYLLTGFLKIGLSLYPWYY